MELTTLFTIPEMQRDACISADGQYRWSLSRAWNPDLLAPWVAWIMLNPSTADASVDDPTIRRIIAFSRAWGFGGLAVRNLFALRSPSPDDLLTHSDPVGSENDAAILDIGICPVIVAAWGRHGSYLGRADKVCKTLASHGVRLQCLGVNRDGSPKHPLYVHGSVGLRPYRQEGGK